jgi:hypothetical protein
MNAAERTKALFTGVRSALCVSIMEAVRAPRDFSLGRDAPGQNLMKVYP